MNKISLITLCATMICNMASAQQYLISGCKSDKVAAINNKGDILWQTPVEGADSNDSEVTREGNILYAYKHGAKLVDREQNVIWDFPVTFPAQDLNTATQLPNGNYLIAYCAHPAHIIELDQKGKIISDITFDTKVKRVHQQFRQVIKTKRNSYIIPIMDRGIICEISTNGDIIREVEVGYGPFSVQEIKGGNWLIAGGDGHYIMEFNPKTEKVIRKIEQTTLPYCKLLFVASTQKLKNGNILFANWGGHASNENEPCFVEFDKKNRLVRKFNTIEGFKQISSITLIDKKLEF